MSVNPKVDTPNGLVDVPGLEALHQTVWKIRLLKIQDRVFALNAINSLPKDDFRKLMKIMRLVGTSQMPPHRPHVAKSDNYDVYEMRPGDSRLFFFYDKQTRVAICTHGYDKNSSSAQGTEFAKCDKLRVAYLAWPAEQKTP